MFADQQPSSSYMKEGKRLSIAIRVAVILNATLFALFFVNSIFLQPHFRTLYGWSLLILFTFLLIGTIVQFRRRSGLPEGSFLIEVQLSIACLFFHFILGGLMGD